MNTEKEIMTMNTVRNIAVEFETRTITVSAGFLRQSRVYDSVEFHTMLNLMNELPGFEICVRHISKPAHRPYMPSYDEMISRINMMEEDPAKALEDFEAIRECARISRKGYMMVRAWFIGRYGVRSETGCLSA